MPWEYRAFCVKWPSFDHVTRDPRDRPWWPSLVDAEALYFHTTIIVVVYSQSIVIVCKSGVLFLSFCNFSGELYIHTKRLTSSRIKFLSTFDNLSTEQYFSNFEARYGVIIFLVGRTVSTLKRTSHYLFRRMDSSFLASALFAH